MSLSGARLRSRKVDGGCKRGVIAVALLVEEA